MIEDKTILVLGSAGSIGSKISINFLKEGAKVIFADISKQEIKVKLENLNLNFKEDVWLESYIDINKESSFLKLIESIKNKFGKIDAMVNCTYPKTRNFGKTNYETSYEELCENLNLHLGGYFLSTKQLFNYFDSVRRGNIINFSSIYGFMNPDFILYKGTEMKMPIEYAACKAGIIQMTKYFAKLGLDNGIRCNCISPGGVEDMQPQSFQKTYASKTISKRL